MNQSKLIKSLRGSLTQVEFAKALGISQSRLSKYERGRHEITLNRFIEWCDILGSDIFKK